MTDITIISTPGEFDECLEESHRRPVLLLKHSLTCSISTRALGEFQAFAQSQSHPDVRLSMIEIQNARALSSHVADVTGVRHESPQALLFSAGRVAWHCSHFDITQATLTDALAAATTD